MNTQKRNPYKILVQATTLLLVSISIPITSSQMAEEWTLCSQMISRFQAPCLCGRIQTDKPVTNRLDNASYYYIFDCDHVTLSDGSFPIIPFRLPVEGYSHRYGDFQNLKVNLFTESDVPIRWVDLSHNRLQRITNGMFKGVEDTLEEIRLGHNYLGHQLNPVFATEEFSRLPKLKLLDLSNNRIKAIDDSLFRGLSVLLELHLEKNYFDNVPTLSLRNLPTLNTLHLQHNRIGQLLKNAFSGMTNLKSLNLSNNVIDSIDGGAFTGLENLTTLDLSNNKIHGLNHQDIFANLNSLAELDFSNNFLKKVPSQLLRSVASSLTKLRLGSNGIRELKLDDFAELSALRYLDLSRNRIAELLPTVFTRLSDLRELILDVNLVRNVEESAFDGLQKLERLSLSDNTIFGFPTSALVALPALQSLTLSYNRIAALSPDILHPVRSLRELVLDFNLVSEIPDGTFQNFTNLQILHLRGNHISSVVQKTFLGIDKSLVHLDLAVNGMQLCPAIEMLSNLEHLDLSENQIGSLTDNFFGAMPALKRLNLAGNRLTELPEMVFTDSPRPIFIEDLDLSENHLKALPSGIFGHMPDMRVLDLSANKIQEIQEGSFHNMTALHHVNLALNKIISIHHDTFSSVNELTILNLSGNSLTVFDGGIFDNVLPKLDILDLSNNNIHYLIPNALSSIPGMRHLDLSANKLTIFLEGLLQDAPFLETLLLQNNELKRVDHGQFSHAIRLRRLDLSDNQIEIIGTDIFRNSTQVKILDLSRNKLTVLPEEAFDGLAGLMIDLSHNNLTSLPPAIFARNHVSNLISVNLAFNHFSQMPLSNLNEQFAALQGLSVANNHISHVPANANALVNVKQLDLSNNPLSEESLKNIFNEPKTVQELKVANCGVKDLPELETPFLRVLNLSGNNITSIRPETFQRTTMLESLDISNNQLHDLLTSISPVWPKLANLKILNISGNPLRNIGPSDLTNLTHLEALDISRLKDLGRLDPEALRSLRSLKQLSIHGYPLLGFYDLRSILEATPALRSLRVEVKGTVLRDQLHPAFNPRLSNLTIYGASLKNLTSVSFAGLLSPSIDITIQGTSIGSVPNTIFLPLPASSDILIDLSRNHITVLGPQLLITMSEKRQHAKLAGLQSNPLNCDCYMKPMYKWIKERISEGESEWKLLTCHQPEELAKKFLWSLEDEELTCEKRTTTQPSVETPMTQTTEVKSLPPITTTENEPDIIYEAPSPKPGQGDSAQASSSLTNMDSMIIGIIVGVVAFVCILIVIICIIKLRHNRVRYRADAMEGLGSQVPCTCMKSSHGGPNMPPTLCHCHPNYPPHPPHDGHMSAKQMTLRNESRNSTLPRLDPYPNPPYYVTYPESETNDYR